MLHPSEKLQEIDANIRALEALAPVEPQSRIAEVAAGTAVTVMVSMGATGVAAAHESQPAPHYATITENGNLTRVADAHGTTVDALLADPENAEFRANPDMVHPGDQVHISDGEISQTSHRIEPGDTLGELAKQYGISVEALQRINGLSDPDRIYAGRDLIIPANQAERTVIERVDHGETLSEIARDHNTTVQAIMADNPFIRNPHHVEAGWKLHINTTQVTPVETTQSATVRIPAGETAYGIAERIVPLTEENDTVDEVADRIVEANQQDPRRYQANQLLTVPGVSQEVVNQAMAPQETAPAPAAEPVAVEAAASTHVSVQEVFTPEAVAQILPNAPRENVEAYTPLVLNALTEQGLNDPQMVSYAFATINAETSGFAPIIEHASGMAYEPHTRVGQRLGNIHPGDGPLYRGRGFIQLTGRNNYRHMGEVLGIDLENNPDLALDPETAARILAIFLAERQDRILPALEEGDMIAARRPVNGGTHGLNRVATAYETATAIAQNVTIEPAAPTPEEVIPAEIPAPATEIPPVVDEAPEPAAELPTNPEPASEVPQASEEQLPEVAGTSSGEEPEAEEHQHDHEEDEHSTTPMPSQTEGQGSAPVTDTNPPQTVPEPAPATPAAPQHSVAGERLVHPVGERFPVTSDFGPRQAPRTSGGRGSTNHRGTDYGAPTGTPIAAPQDGQVEFAGEKGPNGNLVIIDHGPNSNGQEVETIYAHMDRIDVREGQHIEQGAVIGTVGNTGNSGGAHLHLGVTVGGQHVDPETVVDGPEL